MSDTNEQAGFKLYLVEQDVMNLTGKYLMECVVVAPTAADAKKAALRLEECGVEVRKSKLSATLLGKYTPKKALQRHEVRYDDGKCLILAYTEGTDDEMS